MSFMTYILLVGLQSGKMKSFHPDILGITASFALFIYIIQLLILSLFLYLNNVGSFVNWMDLVSLIGYMFVGAVLNTLIYLINMSPIVHLVLRSYVCIAMAYFTVKFINLVEGYETYISYKYIYFFFFQPFQSVNYIRGITT